MKKESKTSIEWFKTLKEPYRSQAINNCNEDSVDFKSDSLHEALMSSFNWIDSPEGFFHWEEISDNTEAYIESEEPKKLPRMVEVRCFTGVWSKRELLADLSSYDIEEPYFCRNPFNPTLATSWSEMREIEKKQEPLSFGEYVRVFFNHYEQYEWFTDEYNEAYASYQEYLKEFKS